jgi:hypothetical protein
MLTIGFSFVIFYRFSVVVIPFSPDVTNLRQANVYHEHCIILYNLYIKAVI